MYNANTPTRGDAATHKELYIQLSTTAMLHVQIYKMQAITTNRNTSQYRGRVYIS